MTSNITISDVSHFWNADLFSAAAFRYGQLVVWNGRQELRPAVQRGFEETARGSQVAAFSNLLREANASTERLHSAARELTDAVSAWTHAKNMARGVRLGVQRLHEGSLVADSVPNDAELIAMRFALLCEAASFDQCVTALVISAQPYTFSESGHFRTSLARWKKQRFWEAMNLCVADMAIAMTVTAEPLSDVVGKQDQGRASEVVGGRWLGEQSRLFEFCEAAVLREAYLTSNDQLVCGNDPFMLPGEANTTAVGYLQVRGDDAVARLRVADCLGPIPYSWRLDKVEPSSSKRELSAEKMSKTTEKSVFFATFEKLQ